MNAAQFNARVREASRHQRLPGFVRFGESRIRHKWKVTVAAVDVETAHAFDFGINPLTGRPFFSDWVFKQPGKSSVGRLFQVFVGTGCVNDEPACIEYLAQGDPRDWTMPPGYAPYAALRKVFGPSYAFADRPLWEDEPPFLFLTGPNADASDLGGFVRTPDRRRPPLFRTAEMWECELYQASVVITLAPFRSDPAAVNLRTGGARARRWRVTAGKLPTAVADAGVAQIASHELARVYLVRTPGDPELDQIYVQQVTYWNLRARSIIDLRLLELLGIGAEITAAFDLGLLAFGLTGIATGAVLIGIEEAVIALILDNLAAIIAATSGVKFWTV